MLTPYERHLLACYLANAASGLHHRDREASALAEWVTDRENRLACGRRSKRSRLCGTELDPEEGMSAEKLRRLAEALRDECAATKKARSDRTAQRLRSLAPTAGLSRTDIDILELLLRYQSQPIIESMVDNVFGPTGRHINPLNLKGPALSVLLGISANAVHRRFRNDAPLVRSGLVSIDSDGDLTLVGRLLRLATVPGDSSIDVTHLLLGTASASDLEWSDFDHVTADRDHVERLMKGALDSGASGVNVLLYGLPGTGKTQFCKVLAERLGVTLFSVGESDDDGNEPARGERLQELRLAQRLLAGSAHGPCTPPNSRRTLLHIDCLVAQQSVDLLDSVLAQLAHRLGETLTNRMDRQRGAGEHPQRRIGQRQHPLRVQVALIQLRDEFADVVSSQHGLVRHRPSPNWFEGGIVIPILRIDNFSRLRPRHIDPDCLQPRVGRHSSNG